MSEKTLRRLTKEEEIYLSSFLKKLGIPPHILGYEYIQYAVVLIAEDKSYLKQITKKLYPDVAKKFGSKSSRVERAIRHAVEQSFERADIEFLNEIFSYRINLKTEKITNSEYLAVLAEYFRLRNDFVE